MHVLTIGQKTRRVSAVIAGGLLLGTVPGLATAAAAHAATPTSISITASPSTTTAGGSLALVARLGVASKSVSFYEQIKGQKAHKLITVKTDANGNAAIRGTVRYTSSFIASFAGDSAYDSSRAAVSVSVKAKITAKDTGGKARTGYRLYKANHKATTTVKVGPSKTGKKVTFRLQKVVKGKWKALGTKTVKLKKGSKAKLSHVGFAGSRFRVRVEYKGDAVNAANKSKWNYQTFK